ncbi:MAG: GH3 auxin-responsive promoter family protein [Chitinophagaceae bacterium]|nr:GH3 auxin-responsive promoter family protein [Chitinophagaceae bacterium]
MAILGNIISRSVSLRRHFDPPLATPEQYQKNTLKHLLEKARYTSFGKHYDFSGMLDEELDFVKAFRSRVDVRNYNKMHNDWWHRCMEGEENVTWPGKVKYFALSSGTSESASKHIPVTQDMIKSVKKVGFKQFYSMIEMKVPASVFEKGVLMLGGTTSLFEKGEYYEGDMSGISAKNMPKWLSSLFYKPGQKISRRPNWEDRIKLIVRKAPQWDVATICGVPAWVQIVMEEVINYHKVDNIHDIWPNLSVYIHGGVSFEPYKESFKKLLGKPVNYIETYMSSEGSFGFRARTGTQGIKLVLNAGIFYEFVPFTDENFDADGNIIGNPKTYMIHEVDDTTNYAMLISTCAGAWRYLIGDVIRFTDVAEHEIAIVGRTKQFLSLCGEHLSVDNMNKAIEIVSRELNIESHEFTVAGYKYENLFAHRWYIGCEACKADINKVRELLDSTLCELNDDYAVERTSALKEIFVEMVPNDTFYDYMKAIGKSGAMNKFPRVLKGEQYNRWAKWLDDNNIERKKA